MTAIPPASFQSPGVVAREVDLSTFIAGPGATTLALLGIFEKGPIAEPTIVRSLPQAQRIFGAFLSDEFGMHAIKHFFDQGGQQISVGRTAHYTDITDPTTLIAIKATKTLVDRAGSPLDTLRVDAVSEGAWANGATGGISVAVLDGTVDPAAEFRIEVFFNDERLEIFDNLSMDPSSNDYVERRVNGNSALIEVTDLDSATTAPDNRPALLAETSGDIAGGDDGLTGLSDSDFTGDENAQTGIFMFDVDTTSNLIAIPGRTGIAVDTALVAYAENRQTMFALTEPPSGQSVANAVAYREQTAPFSGAPIDSSYGGIIYPWLRLSDPVTALPRIFPPTGAWGGLIAASDAVVNVWGAPAGLNRGVLKQVISTEIEIGQAQADTLFPSDVNPILRRDGVGFVVFGQNTLQRRTSATDRMNVRRMLIFVEQQMVQIAESILFEPNNDVTRNSFKRPASSFLQTIQDQGGITEFAIVVDDSNNPPESVQENRLNIDVFIKPTLTAEFITINVVITAQGAELTEIFAAT
jgi:hypothetical protein